MDVTTVTIYWQKSTKNKEVYAEVVPEGQAKGGVTGPYGYRVNLHTQGLTVPVLGMLTTSIVSLARRCYSFDGVSLIRNQGGHI